MNLEVCSGGRFGQITGPVIGRRRSPKASSLTADNYATKKGGNIFEITRGEQWETMASLLDAFSSHSMIAERRIVSSPPHLFAVFSACVFCSFSLGVVVWFFVVGVCSVLGVYLFFSVWV